MFELPLEQGLLVYAAVASYLLYKCFWLLWPPPSPPCNYHGEDRRKIPFTPPSKLDANVEWSHSFIRNPRGMLLCTYKYVRTDKAPKGILFLCHGFTDGNVSGNMWDRANRFAREGWAVHAIDYEGHGLSDGLLASIEDFDQMVDDVYVHFKAVRAGYGNEVPAFILGESMGGAVAIKLSLLEQRGGGVLGLRGVVLIAPMVKIADEMKPPKAVLSILMAMAPVLPTLPGVPAPNLIKQSFRRPDRLQILLQSPYAYTNNLRLGTVLQLSAATDSIDRQMEDFTTPFLLLQGGADVVTDPVLAKEFYNRASSKDKRMELYEGAWHSLLYGEFEELAERVYADILSWMDERIKPGTDRRKGR